MNEEYQIIPIDAETWRIEDGMVRCYLLAGTERALLVDTGMTLKNAREIAEGLTHEERRASALAILKSCLFRLPRQARRRWSRVPSARE